MRMKNRLLCADILSVEWTERSGAPRLGTALLEDISAAGACLQMEVEIPEGSDVNLLYQRITIRATVKYCVYRDIGYFIGVDFLDGFCWSQEQFQTQHLLDLKQFVN